jgi:hypothetical protein
MAGRFIALIGIALLLAVFSACDPFEVDRNVDLDACVDSRCVVTGYVFDTEGNPVQGVNITRTGAGVGYATTDKDGYYMVVGNVQGWSYCLTPTKEDWFFTPEQLCYDHISKNHSRQNFTGWIPNRYDIGGYVTDSQARPMKNVSMTLEGEGGTSVKTDTTGRYLFTGILENHDYCVVPYKTGYVFEPVERCYENLSQTFEAQNFLGSEIGD